MNLNEGADITRELKIGLPLLTYREIWGGYVYPIFLGAVKAIQVERWYGYESSRYLW